MRISDKKKQKISEQILFYLFTKNPVPVYTSYIAQEIARDEEFVKKLLLELKKKKLVTEIKKSKFGFEYLRRSRWKLAPVVYELYSKKQDTSRLP